MANFVPIFFSPQMDRFGKGHTSSNLTIINEFQVKSVKLIY